MHCCSFPNRPSKRNSAFIIFCTFSFPFGVREKNICRLSSLLIVRSIKPLFSTEVITLDTREFDNPIYSQMVPADLGWLSFRQQSSIASLIVISWTSEKAYSNWNKDMYMSLITQIASMSYSLLILTYFVLSLNFRDRLIYLAFLFKQIYIKIAISQL